MNRRELLKTLATALPASAVVTVEPEIQRSDVIVVHANEYLDDEQIRNMRIAIGLAFGDHPSLWPTILVLDKSVTLTVERNVARVQVPMEKI